ncbi:MAG: hypothetical protein K8I82_01315 [Anaerolineae bacterium]|jgi:hypothetical protein|nr:hypothetical protein [Anaerolineae bacterium]
MAIYESVYQALISVSHRKSRHPASLTPPVVVEKQGAPWWQVYLMTAAFLAVLFAIPFLIASSSTTKMLELGVMIFYYRTVLQWTKNHSAALNREVQK